MTPEEAAVAAKREKEQMLLAGSMGGIACFGGVLFWALNQMDRSGRRRVLRQQAGERIDWP